MNNLLQIGKDTTISHKHYDTHRKRRTKWQILGRRGLFTESSFVLTVTSGGSAAKLCNRRMHHENIRDGRVPTCWAANQTYNK